MVKNKITDESFGRLIFQHQAIIHKVCHVYCSTEVDKQDLFQEIVIRLWKGINQFRGEAKITSWIYRVSLNLAISTSSKRKKSRINYMDQIPDNPRMYNSEDGISERKKALYKGIEELKPLEKAIILLYLENKSYDEIAEIMGITKSNVSVKLVRTKRKLEKLVKEILKTS